MSGLWRNNPNTPEGKYPVVLRRDGTPLTARSEQDRAAAVAVLAAFTETEKRYT